MKSESGKAALEAAARTVADLKHLIREFEVVASDLDREITAEENRTGIKDPVHFAYSNFAKSASQRRDNLHASAAVLKLKLDEVQRERDDALEQLNRANVARRK